VVRSLLISPSKKPLWFSPSISSRSLHAGRGCRGGLGPGQEEGVHGKAREDDPDPDQVEIMVRRFDEVGPDVACLQGILDYHHSRHNWLARCFTIEYAAWFRAQLPGVARLGLVVPLGGTTLFFRREALEELGGWDAHNVTEDADLGLRLARAGYRTELVATVTHEEPNARPLKWIRQRSRWLKGAEAFRAWVATSLPTTRPLSLTDTDTYSPAG